MSTVTIKMKDETGLDASVGKAWVAGWINGNSGSFATLSSTGSFGSPGATLPFFAVDSLPPISLTTATNGNDRLVFVVSPQCPDGLPIDGQIAKGYTQFPTLVAPGIAAPGPYDIFEFGMNAQFDLSAVSGFGLNLRFTVEPAIAASMAEKPKAPPPFPRFGVDKAVSRAKVGTAFTTFIANQAAHFAAAADFAELLYDAPLKADAYQPPLIGGQYFGICDPNDMLAAKSGNYGGSTQDPLETFWDEPLQAFFTIGNSLSINLGSEAAPNIFSGTCQSGTNPTTQASTNVYTLTNAAGESHSIYCPPAGLQSARYVFQQSFDPSLCPAGSGGNAGLLQDCIWEALCRGVAQAGVEPAGTQPPLAPGYSTSAWNDASKWYPQGKACHFYAKFLHCSDVDGNDARKTGKPPILYGGAAYGFSMDENPIGPYSGPNVPSKTAFSISEGTVTVTVGAWT